MENQKNDNLNMLEAIVQNTEMGKNTLDQLVPMAEDEQFKRSFCASAISTASSIRKLTPPSTPAAARPRARVLWRSSTPR